MLVVGSEDVSILSHLDLLPAAVGHGRSEGYRLHVETYDTYTTDVIQHVEQMKKQYPSLPSFIMGHSMVR